MRKNEKKSIFSLGPNGPILQNFLVVQYLVGSLKIPSDGSNNLIFLDQVKRHCVISQKLCWAGQGRATLNVESPRFANFSFDERKLSQILPGM